MGIWYRTGTASVSNGAAVVTGSLTTWLVYVRPGDRITFNAGAKWYEVLSVDSNTQITLATNFAETTVSGGAYAIDPASYRHQIESDILEQLRQVLVGQENVINAGFKFTFSSSVTMADPGIGYLRLNNAALSSVTAIAVDDQSADMGNPNVRLVVATWDDSSSTAHRGYLKLQKFGAPQNYVLYDITGTSTNASGYIQLVVTYVSHAGSFANGDTLVATFSRTGENVLGYTPVNKAGDTMDTNLKWSAGTDISSTDLDALTSASGYYYGNNLTNSPDGTTNWFHIHNYRLFGSASYILQFGFLGTGTSPAPYVRLRNNGTWGSWQKIWCGTNDGAGSGLDADLLDGKNTGTSGNTIPLLDGANTWSAQQTFSAALALNSGQINFPAAQSASAGANVLDDYEEGTFTPVLAGTTAAGAGTYTVQAGNYTKIGRLVTVQLTLTWTAHTGTGNMKITGLPFTAAALNVAAVRFSSVTFTGQFMAYVSNSTTEISILSAATGAGEAGIAMDTAATISMTLTYHV